MEKKKLEFIEVAAVWFGTHAGGICDREIRQRISLLLGDGTVYGCRSSVF